MARLDEGKKGKGNWEPISGEWEGKKRPSVETEGRLTIACHMKRDNDLVDVERKIKRSGRNLKSCVLSNS